jgi:hypothetical protein
MTAMNAMNAMNANPTNDVRDRITRTSHKMLDVIDRILDQLAPPAPRLGSPPPDVRRRQLANILHLFTLCPRSTCRRSGCCRGEPLHCLRIAIPLLPPEAFAGILTPRQRHRRRRDAASSAAPPP